MTSLTAYLINRGMKLYSFDSSMYSTVLGMFGIELEDYVTCAVPI